MSVKEATQALAKLNGRARCGCPFCVTKLQPKPRLAFYRFRCRVHESRRVRQQAMNAHTLIRMPRSFPHVAGEEAADKGRIDGFANTESRAAGSRPIYRVGIGESPPGRIDLGLGCVKPALLPIRQTDPLILARTEMFAYGETRRMAVPFAPSDGVALRFSPMNVVRVDYPQLNPVKTFAISRMGWAPVRNRSDYEYSYEKLEWT